MTQNEFAHLLAVNLAKGHNWPDKLICHLGGQWLGPQEMAEERRLQILG